MESSEEWIRATESCPLPFVDMGFLQQYVQETYSDKGASWMDLKLGFIYHSFYNFTQLVI